MMKIILKLSKIGLLCLGFNLSCNSKQSDPVVESINRLNYYANIYTYELYSNNHSNQELVDSLVVIFSELNNYRKRIINNPIHRKPFLCLLEKHYWFMLHSLGTDFGNIRMWGDIIRNKSTFIFCANIFDKIDPDNKEYLSYEKYCTTGKDLTCIIDVIDEIDKHELSDTLQRKIHIYLKKQVIDCWY